MWKFLEKDETVIVTDLLVFKDLSNFHYVIG